MTGMFCLLKTPVLQHTHMGYRYPRGDGRLSRRPAQVPGAGLPGGSSPRSHRGCLSVCPGVTAAGRLRLWRAGRPAPRARHPRSGRRDRRRHGRPWSMRGLTSPPPCPPPLSPRHRAQALRGQSVPGKRLACRRPGLLCGCVMRTGKSAGRTICRAKSSWKTDAPASRFSPAAEVAVVLHATGPLARAVAPGRRWIIVNPGAARARRASQAHAAGILAGVRQHGLDDR